VNEGREAWQKATRMLAVRLDSLGDVLMTAPAIRALKQSVPGRSVTLLTSPAGAAAAALIPEIDDVIIFEAPWMKATPLRLSQSEDEILLARLQGERFDAAVIFTVFSQNPLPAATYCYLAGIPLRLAHCRESPYQLLTDWIRETEPVNGIRHEVQRQLDLVAQIGAQVADTSLRLNVVAGDRAATQRLIETLGLEPGRWYILHPGATAASRRYPPERFVEVAQQLAELGYRAILTGSSDERELVESIRRPVRGSVSLAGRLSLGELAALIESAPLLITNNTGPAHLAAGVGTPIVDLYALTNPQHTPWQVRSRVLSCAVPCGPCFRSVCPEEHHPCLRGVRSAEVVTAALELFRPMAPSPTSRPTADLPVLT
jgi:lipopolysaccharide heptosyltransferase II